MRFFTGMDFCMVFEMCGLIEGGTADITPIWLLAGVNSSMIPER